MKLASHLLAAALLSLPLLVGCGGSGGDGSSSSDTLEIKTYELKNLLPAEFDTPDLDGNRVKIPTPKGWKIGDRQNKILIRFYTEDPNSLPRIVMTAEPSPYAGIDSVTEDNIVDLSDLMQAELDQKFKETERTQYREPCRPIFVGDNAWVRYVAAGKWKGHGVERVILRTVFDKRLYTIELNVMTGKIRDFQKGAYSVAGRMVFNVKGGAAAPEASKLDAAKPDEPNTKTDDKPGEK